MNRQSHRLSFIALSLLLSACTVGPDYTRPDVDAPAQFRAPDPSEESLRGTNSIADLDWWDVYEDPQLKQMIAEALTNSWDIKVAAARVLQAEAVAGITRSQRFPSVYAGGDLYDSRASERGKSTVPKGVDPDVRYGDAFVFAPSYEIDLWGRVRRANEAARANLLAAEESRRTVRQTLVEQVAATYLRLLEHDLSLKIGCASYINRTNSLDLTKSRESGGVASMQDVYQAKVLVATAESSIVDTHRLIEQTENALCLLLGRNPNSARLCDPDGHTLAWKGGCDPEECADRIVTDADCFPVVYPWDLLRLHEEVLAMMDETSLLGEVSPLATINGCVRLGKGSVIHPGTVIEGPVLIGPNSQIGPNAYIRGATSIGANCYVGNGAEVKNSIVYNNSYISRQCYVGDSIIGTHVTLGAGTCTENHRHDGRHHTSMVQGKPVNTGRLKFGAVLGDGVKTGVNTSIEAGVKIGIARTTKPGAYVSKDML